MTKIRCRQVICVNNDGDFNCDQDLVWLGSEGGCGQYEKNRWKASIWLNHVCYDLVKTRSLEESKR